MSKEFEWLFSGFGTNFVFWVIGLLIALLLFINKNNKKRVLSAVGEYKILYKKDGVRLNCLIPAGIHTLKSNREIKLFFKLLLEIEPNHPLMSWDVQIKSIGYKKFFSFVFLSGKELNKNTINSFVDQLKK
jgi:hypothetical protein